MSDSSAGVYKSKLFNFLNRRSHQLIDQSKTVLRHLQVASIWGVQIALYPVYLLIQTSRVFIQQLQESVGKNSSRYLGDEEVIIPSLPPAVDRPIPQVLQLVEDFLNPEQVSNLSTFLPFQRTAALLEPENKNKESKNQGFLLASPLSSSSSILPIPSIVIAGENEEQQLNNRALGIEKLGIEYPLALKKESRFVVQGVASLIVSKSLVLIDTNNQVLDILTPEQQQKLAKKIIWEVASYGYDRRRFLQSQHLAQRPANQQLPIPTSPRVFLPAKWFWRLMTWVQRGEVAITANLFQESSLPQIAPARTFLELPSFSLPFLPIPSGTIERFDRQIYHIELNQIVPASQWLTQVGGDLLPRIISPEQLIAQDKTAGVNTQDSAQQGNIWELIQGAIVYFFGKKPSRLADDQTHLPKGYQEGTYLLVDNSRDSRENNHLPQSQPYQEFPFSEDDWLTSEDLFQLPTNPSDNYEDEDMIDLPSVAETKLLSQSNYPHLPQIMAAQGRRSPKFLRFTPPPQKSRNSSKVSLPPKTQRSSPQLPNSNNSKSTSAASTSIRNQGDNKQNKLTNSGRKPSSLGNNSTDWIETEVTSKGYVKHPLQKSVEFLDEIVLWIEKILSQIWRLIKKIVRI